MCRLVYVVSQILLLTKLGILSSTLFYRSTKKLSNLPKFTPRRGESFFTACVLIPLQCYPYAYSFVVTCSFFLEAYMFFLFKLHFTRILCLCVYFFFHFSSLALIVCFWSSYFSLFLREVSCTVLIIAFSIMILLELFKFAIRPPRPIL